MTDVSTDVGAPNPFEALLDSIDEAAILVRAAVLRNETPHGGLSAAMIAVRCLHMVCESCIEADTSAFLAAVAALHSGEPNEC